MNCKVEWCSQTATRHCIWCNKVFCKQDFEKHEH
jgi:hypothetical protein